MELPRIRPFARRAAFTAALGALLVPAAVGTASADAAKKRYPTVTSVRPMDTNVGDTITLRGRNYIRGKNKNTVVFKRDGARAVFVKTTLSTARQIRVKVPESLRAFMAERTPTRFRLRVLSRRFSKRFTANKNSPNITALPKPVVVLPGAPGAPGVAAPGSPGAPAPAPAPPRVCTGDEDGDMLDVSVENNLGLDGCNPDTDGDGASDGYEYQSARDLNDDEYQEPNQYLPYPGKRPYPNPLDPDATTDHDGDGLPLIAEYRLWNVYGARPAGGVLDNSFRLLYSAGEAYSLSTRDAGTGRRRPSQPANTYTKFAEFLAWAGGNGYNPVMLAVAAPWHDPANQQSFDIRDTNRSGAVDGAGRPGYLGSEAFPYDLDGDSFMSDDERDEDADGLTNIDEYNSRGTRAYWKGCYVNEAAYLIEYSGSDLTDRDSDGDTVIDGADDQDFDDVPNVMEVSRNMASGEVDWDGHDGQCVVSDTIPTTGPDGPDEGDEPDPLETWHPAVYGRVNPYNPCLPFDWSRTCERHHMLEGPPAPFDGSTDWFALQ